MIRFTEFTKDDWMGFSGCEPFADGGEPLTAEIKVDGVPATIALDKNGMMIVWYLNVSEDDSDTHFVTFSNDLAARVVAKLQPEMTSAQLKALGGEVEC